MQVVPGLCTVRGVPTLSHDSESTVPPRSKKFRANGLVHFRDDRPFTMRDPPTKRRAVVDNFNKDLRTFSRRATPLERPSVAGQQRHLFPPSHHWPSYHFHGRCGRPYQSTTRHSILDHVCSDSSVSAEPSTQHHQRSSFSPHVSQILARARCRGGCEGVGKGEHNRVARLHPRSVCSALSVHPRPCFNRCC